MSSADFGSLCLSFLLSKVRNISILQYSIPLFQSYLKIKFPCIQPVIIIITFSSSCSQHIKKFSGFCIFLFFIFSLGRSLLMRSCFHFFIVYVYGFCCSFSLCSFIKNYLYALVISYIYIVLHNSFKLCDQLRYF